MKKIYDKDEKINQIIITKTINEIKFLKMKKHKIIWTKTEFFFCKNQKLKNTKFQLLKYI